MSPSPHPKEQEPAPAFDETAGSTHAQLIAIEHGAVQFRGRRKFALQDDVVTVPLPIVFLIAGQLLQLLASDVPAGNALRAHIAGAVKAHELTRAGLPGRLQ